MSLRLLAVVVVAVLFALAQITLGSERLPGASDTVAWPGNGMAPSVVSAQGDNDNDEDADNDDDDNNENDADDDDDGDDNENDADDDDGVDNDNEEDGEDNDNGEDADNDDDNEDADNGDVDDDFDNEFDDNFDDDGVDDAPPPPVDATLPLIDASGTSNGGDVAISLGGERLIVRMFPWMPNGVTVTLRRAAPEQFALVPGTIAGDLLFTIEARDATGVPLESLPAEINVSVRYNDADVVGLNEQNLTLSRLDPATNMWQQAPKGYRDPTTNYIAASVTALGAYVVYAP